MTYRQRQTCQIKSPARWPNGVCYLQSCQFHESVSPSFRDFVKGNSSIAGQLPVSHPNYVTIRHIVNPAHPANGQRGLFATSHIKPNTRILDYNGRLNQGMDAATLTELFIQVKYIAMIAHPTTTSVCTVSLMV